MEIIKVIKFKNTNHILVISKTSDDFLIILKLYKFIYFIIYLVTKL